jgi:hypothetical protein
MKLTKDKKIRKLSLVVGAVLAIIIVDDIWEVATGILVIIGIYVFLKDIIVEAIKEANE